jgi:hypothetical protein
MIFILTLLKKPFKIMLFYRENSLNLAFFSFLPGPEPAMASVSVDDVREMINISSAEVSDSKIAKMIKRAEVTLELETGKQIDYNDCTDAEKEFITVLAAIYAICYLTGGSAVGLSFSIGDKNVSVIGDAPPLNVLRAELERILKGIKGVYVGRV